jgi:methylated-DNA-[protein]-cysteine S-methyltransferase
MDSEIKSTATAHFASPLGTIELTQCDGYITGLDFIEAKNVVQIPLSLQASVNQINDWFAGRIKTFNLPVKPGGTPFQLLVWKMLAEIPYGQTATYGELAQKLGIKNGSRAVGLANGANPVSLIIPCHRVIGANGRLTGYRGGLWRKEWLLRFEKENTPVGLFDIG